MATIDENVAQLSDVGRGVAKHGMARLGTATQRNAKQGNQKGA